MQHPLDSIVIIADCIDDTGRTDLIGRVGKVSSHNINGMTGNFPEDPLHVVVFDNGDRDSFWFEELKKL